MAVSMPFTPRNIIDVPHPGWTLSSLLTHSQPEFDETKPNGGNPNIEDVNAQYQGLEFHYLYLIIMSFLVWLIIPGIAFLYAGLARRKSALSLLFQSLAVMGV